MLPSIDSVRATNRWDTFGGSRPAGQRQSFRVLRQASSCRLELAARPQARIRPCGESREELRDLGPD